MKIGVCQETARLWRRARHTAMLSRSWRFASMSTTSGRAAGARSRSSRPLATDRTRYPSGSSMLSSAWLSHVPALARSTTGGRVKGVRRGICAGMWGRRRGGEPGETLDAAGRRPGSGRDQALPDRIADQTGDVVDVQLLHDTRAVKLGGFGSDPEQRGDLFGRLAFGHELHDLALTGGPPAPVAPPGRPAPIH